MAKNNKTKKGLRVDEFTTAEQEIISLVIHAYLIGLPVNMRGSGVYFLYKDILAKLNGEVVNLE